MIKEVYGNILLSQAGAIVQGIANNEDFSQGLASSVKEKWPGIEDDFKQCCCNSKLQPGDLWAWKNADGTDVINLITRGAPNNTSGTSSLDNLDHSLARLGVLVEERGIKSLAVPKIGTDVGGLDWRDVKPLIEKHLGKLKIPVYLYTIYSKNMAAVED